MDSEKRKGKVRGSLDPQLHAWLDRELSAEERTAAETRLASDAEARERLNLIDRCEEWLTASAPAVPPGLSERILGALRDKKGLGASDVAAAGPRRKVAGWLWITGLSAAAAAVLIFLWLGGPGSGDRSLHEPIGQTAESPAPAKVGHEFLLDAPGARQVCLVGDFNGWEVCRTPMDEVDRGRFRIRLDLPPGRHEYMFVVDGRWMTDPRAALRIDDGFGSQNAVVLL